MIQANIETDHMNQVLAECSRRFFDGLRFKVWFVMYDDEQPMGLLQFRVLSEPGRDDPLVPREACRYIRQEFPEFIVFIDVRPSYPMMDDLPSVGWLPGQG